VGAAHGSNPYMLIPAGLGADSSFFSAPPPPECQPLFSHLVFPVEKLTFFTIFPDTLSSFFSQSSLFPHAHPVRFDLAEWSS
jgi:hypothetical protein